VVQNLVGNAIKYGKSGGWIGIRARSTGRDVQLTVSDRGIGIEPAEQPRIFEPFYRAPGVIDAQIQGAGLGLSLVQRIVDAHGGRIIVQSTPGSGSEFTVHLPAASFDSREGALAQDRSFDSREGALAQDRSFDSREGALAQDRSSESRDSALPDVQGRASA
jgi:K+-sensing histidine kinase KdpD